MNKFGNDRLIHNYTDISIFLWPAAMYQKLLMTLDAFKEQNNVSQLTLMVRESGTGLSASKQ